MRALRIYRALAWGCVIGGIGWVGFGRTARPQAATPTAAPVFHHDPQHLWNRLHEALFVRTTANGQEYGRDRLEPLLWYWSKHLLEPQSCDRAVAVLDEFIRTRGERQIESPVKRAVLQRDLWLVINWVQAPHGYFPDAPLAAEVWQGSQARLRERLATVIGRLALRPAQIRRLPDNYAAALASRKFARQYRSDHPDEPFLPADLFARDSPWVCLGRPDGPVATTHLGAENPYTNSALLVFLRLPAGREATLDYLRQLRTFDQPLMIRNAERPGNAFVPNPALPKLPVGTQTALVRRALLIDAGSRVASSPITESVQLRVYREVPEMTPQVLEQVLIGNSAAAQRARAWTVGQEFRLSRPLLFARQAGGLRSFSDERDWETGFQAHPFDQLETPQGRPVVKQTCFSCHSLPGSYSFNSFFNFRVARGAGDPRPAALTQVTPAGALELAVKWKQDQPDWAALRDLLTKQNER